MAEELICIAKMIDKGEDKDLKHFKIYSRQEAIEKMAKAICGNTGSVINCGECEYIGTKDCQKYYRYNWLEVAESTLNALLGE